MATRVLARGTGSKTAMVVVRPLEEPWRVLQAIQNATTGCSRIVLAQLTPFANPARNLLWRSPWQGNGQPNPPADHNVAQEHANRSTAWAQVLNRVFLIGSASAAELPGLIRQMDVDRVVTPCPATAEVIWQMLGAERDAFELAVPLWVMNSHAAADERSRRPIRSVLFPLSLRPGFEGRLHLACRLAKAYDATLSILHVFSESSATPGPERSPLLVHARLPLRSLRLSGLLRPMEVAVRAGDPVETILDFQRKGGHDLIFMRGSGLSSLGRPGRGSASRRIISEAHCPVVLVRNPPETPAAYEAMIAPEELHRDLGLKLHLSEGPVN